MHTGDGFLEFDRELSVEQLCPLRPAARFHGAFAGVLSAWWAGAV